MKKEIYWNKDICSMVWNVLCCVENDIYDCNTGYELLLSILGLEDIEEEIR